MPIGALRVMALVAAALAACSGEGDSPSPDASRPVGMGACGVEVQQHASQGGAHTTSAAVAMTTYNSNPPSSGPHCGTTVTYGVASAPVDRCNWLHNLEHGAIVLLYNCPEGCADLVTQLTDLLRDAPRDPDCNRLRVIVTPYPMLSTRVAAAAWRRTWTANCLDEAARASLLKFIGDNL